MNSDQYKGKFYELDFQEGVLFVDYIDGPITLDVAKELVVNRLKLVDSKPVPVLVDVVNVNGIEREARNYLSSEEGVQGLIAGAIVTNSVFTRHMANFFMKISFSKSKMPARMFANKKDALKWLKQFNDAK